MTPRGEGQIASEPAGAIGGGPAQLGDESTLIRFGG
jgi:hypothetical protein